MLDAFLTYIKERFYIRRRRWQQLASVLPRLMLLPLRFLLTPWDAIASMRFVSNRQLPLSLAERIRIVRSFYDISSRVDCPHDESEALEFLTAILSLPDATGGCVVEAGCYKGGSAAKFSIAAHRMNRKLVLFDSFAGLPQSSEPHAVSVFGRKVSFQAGDWCGTLEEVKDNITRYGHIDVCRFVPGWFENTLPEFREPIAAIYLDVDLASSTRTCLKYLYPLLVPGGSLFAQDGHLPLVLEVYNDEEFWRHEVGCPRPLVHGLGKQTLLSIVKSE